MPPDHPSGLRDRVVAAVVLALLADGVAVAIALGQSHAMPSVVALAAFETAGFLALPLALAGLPLAWTLSRPEVLTLGRQMRAGLSGGQPEHENLATVLYIATAGLGATFASWIGLQLTVSLSTRVGAILTVALVFTWTLGMAMPVAIVARPLGRPIALLVRRFPWLPNLAPPLVATVGILTLCRLLPASHVLTPAGAILGFAIGPLLKARLPWMRGPRRITVPALVAGASALSVASATFLSHVPPAVQMAVLYRAPYASIAIAAVHRAVDRDGDGYSPLLLGGDCNDSDSAIHPGAIDTPDNGIDENCSGEDTHVYVPPPEPAAAPYPEPLPPRASVVLVQLDATRPDHTSLAGYRRPTTPRLDRFAQSATWFTHAYTPAPTTRLAMASLFTGWDVDRIPQRRGPGINFTLLPEARTFAERLAEAGYDTYGYTISYVLQHHISQGQGFRMWTTPWPVDMWEMTYGQDALLTTDAGIKYLGEKAQDGAHPFLLFLHYRCTHDPYIKHPEWDFGDSDVDRYDSAMAYCDSQIGRLIDAIDTRTDKDRTAVILFSDHGELFGEHGLTNHGNSLFEPDVRILLVARVPKGTVRRVDDPVSLMDVAPTILVPYAVTVPSTPRPKRALFLYADIVRANVHYEARGVVDRPYKYIHDLNANVNMLFDLDRDPEELLNVADAAPRTRERLAEMVDSWETYARTPGNATAETGPSPKIARPWRRKP
jgi:arylsulfatase A-like enzyme